MYVCICVRVRAPAHVFSICLLNKKKNNNWNVELKKSAKIIMTKPIKCCWNCAKDNRMSYVDADKKHVKGEWEEGTKSFYWHLGKRPHFCSRRLLQPAPAHIASLAKAIEWMRSYTYIHSHPLTYWLTLSLLYHDNNLLPQNSYYQQETSKEEQQQQRVRNHQQQQ